MYAGPAVVDVAGQYVNHWAPLRVHIHPARRRKKEDKIQGETGDNVGVQGERQVVVRGRSGEGDEALR